MKELVEVIAKALVDNPEEVVVTEKENGRNLTIELHVAPSDMGKVIGKQGRIAKAIRAVVKAAALGEKKQVDVVMFGHTHVPFIDIGHTLTILNPGSLSYPRQASRKPTFLLMEIDENGQAHYGHGYYKSKFSELTI